MKKAILVAVMMAFVAAPAFAQTEAAVQAAPAAVESAPSIIAASQAAASGRQTLVTAEGVRLGRITRANDDGAVRIIFDGRVVTVPASTLSLNGDRLTTSLTRAEVNRLGR